MIARNLTFCMEVNFYAKTFEKEKNIRNHLFEVYGIINQVKKEKSDPIDISVYDIEKCFDQLWLEELVNDLYYRGLVNDKLALIYELNKDIKVAVKTPVGLTSRVQIERKSMQGSVWSSLKCSNQMDGISEELMDRKDNIYLYKNTFLKKLEEF